MFLKILAVVFSAAAVASLAGCSAGEDSGERVIAEYEESVASGDESVGQSQDALKKRSCKVIDRGGGYCEVVCCLVSCSGFACTPECSTGPSTCGPIIYDPSPR